MSVKGTTSPVEQSGSTYVVRNDGLVEATLTYIEVKGSGQPANAFTGGTSSGNISGGSGGGSNISAGSESSSVSGQRNTSSNKGIPGVGSEHPKATGLFCVRRTDTYGELGLKTTTCEFLGIDGEETERYLFYNAGVNSENIDAHPRFNEIGGTPSEPKNGATFDDNGQFTGFESASAFAGEANYYAPGASVEVTYYTYKKPNINDRMKIFDAPRMGDNFFQKPEPKDKINYLLTDIPYREVVPGSGLYQVTEQYLQSDEYGWNTRIYQKGEA